MKRLKSLALKSVVLSALILAASPLAHAQELTTTLARKLMVTAPGDTKSGGVPWFTGVAVLPRSWSSEGNGVRTEIAELSPEATEDALKARLVQVLPGVTLKAVNVSGFEGWEGESGNASILGVPTRSSLWVVLARGTDAKKVTDTVVMERDEPAGWMPRVLPGGYVSFLMPYNMNPRRNARNWELHFNGFYMDYLLDAPGADKKLDIKSTVDKAIADFNATKGYSDKSSKRQKAGSGEFVIFKFKEGSTRKEKVFLAALAGKEGFTLSWTFEADRKDHREYSNRLLSSFKTTNDSAITGRRIEFGTTGLSIETRAKMTRTDNGSSQEWTGDSGGLVVTARVVPTQGTASVDTTQTASFFPPAVKALIGDKPGFKVETVPYMVSGMYGHLVKTEWQGAWRYGLFIGAINGIYVVDVMGSNKFEVESTIRSTQLTVAKENTAMKLFSLEGSFLKVLNFPKATVQKDKTDKNYALVEALTMTSPGEGVFGSTLQTLKADEAEVADLQKQSADLVTSLAAALKGKSKILAQDWGSEHLGALYWTIYTIELNGTTFECYLTMVAAERQVLIQNILYISKDTAVRGAGQIVSNSYRLSKK